MAIAVMGRFELLGEMGAVDGAPHGATARALEPCRLRAIPRKEFKAWLQQEPDAAVRVIAALVQRLRAANSMIAGHRAPAVGAAPASGVSLFGAVASWLRLKRPRAESPVGPVLDAEVPFRVGVAILNNDVDAGWTRALAGTLENRSGVAVRVLETAVLGPGGADQVQVMAAAARGRQAMAAAGDLDLLIWGDVHEEVLALVHAGRSRRRGPSGQFRPLSAPRSPVRARAAARRHPLRLDPRRDRTSERSGGDAPAPPAAGRARHDRRSGQDDSAQLGPVRGRAALTCLGHACATRAGIDGDVRWYDRAQAAYRAGLQRLPRGEHGPDEAQLRRHLGGVLLALGEKRQDPALIEAAVGEYRAAVESLVKSAHPLEWGGGQNRLGLALYRLDLLTGRVELLKDAATAFQGALSVFSRAESPARWAEVMNNLAQVLQVFGDQTKSLDVLERAVEVSRSALEVRNRERNPLAWASSQNSLGSALFLLDKHSERTGHLEEAAAAFSAALDVYRAMGAARPAAVAEKNLARVRQLFKEQGSRKVAKPDWAAEDRK